MVDIEGLLKALYGLKYVSESCLGGKREEYNIISNYGGQQTIVRNAVEGWWKDQEARTHIREAELEAKVYTYEKIIANSNFKPLIERGVDNG